MATPPNPDRRDLRVLFIPANYENRRPKAGSRKEKRKRSRLLNNTQLLVNLSSLLQTSNVKHNLKDCLKRVIRTGKGKVDNHMDTRAIEPQLLPLGLLVRQEERSLGRKQPHETSDRRPKGSNWEKNDRAAGPISAESSRMWQRTVTNRSRQ